MKFVSCMALVALLLSMTLSSRGLAEESSLTERETLPTPTVTTEGTVCLDVEQWKQVLKVSNQNKGLFEWRLEILPVLSGHQLLIQDYERIIDNLELEVTLLQKDRDFWKARITEEKDFSLELQKSERLSVLGWKITAGVGWAGVLALGITALAVN
jgi:hypothetical protein